MNGKVAKKKEPSLKHKNLFYCIKKFSNTVHVPRDTVGSIMCKFKTAGTASKFPGRGTKSNISIW